MISTVRSFFSILMLIISLMAVVQSQCDNAICECQNLTCSNCLISQFYYNSTALNCNLCPPQCKSCNAKQQCLSCRQMFYLSGTSCLQCQKYCRTCNSAQSCTQSKNGYILVNSICQKCQVPNVETCESLLTVKTCLTGYWKNGDSCSPCREFCSFCTSSNNCLKCQDGYMIQASAGTYCVACSTGCKTCSDTSTCTECFLNWRLVNNTCISIKPNCSLIENCQSCEYTNNTTRCVICNYPFYLSSDRSCIQGSSILCNYASGKNSYQCVNECSQLAYSSNTIISSTKNINQIICLPRIWIENTMIQQVYFNPLYVSRYQSTFIPNTPPATICSSEYFYSNSFSFGKNSLKLMYIFHPYYKLTFYIKYLPIFRQLFPNQQGLNLTIKMSDNATNTYSALYSFNPSQLKTCQQQYLTISSRNIKDQQVIVQFESTLNPLSYDDSQLSSMFPQGLIGYGQILIQVYRCDSKCRICSNAKYCLQCYGDLFLSSYLCVQSCNGLFEFYQPNGDYLNYKSKYCLQQCFAGYYSTMHPLKNGTYICLKCPPECLTCKSLTQCLSCKSPYLLFSANFSCITTCPNTHYPSINTLECLPCNAPCKTCQNETTCLSCSIGYFNGTNCVSNCPAGMYSSDLLKQCLNCDQKCSACQNTPTFCTSCKQPYKLLGTSCLQSCPLNTYYPFNDTCLACKSPCLLCLSQNLCLTCSRGFLLNNSCLSDCPSGYYKDTGNNKCNLCENDCLTCLSASICKTCVNGTLLYNSMCLLECPIKTYVSANKVCIPCIPPCLTCYNQTSCITCSLGFLSQITRNTCVIQCQDGYYGQSINQLCIKCSQNCKTCSQQPNFCLTCPSNMLLQNNKCVQNCSLGYFAFNNQKCRPCSYPCSSCNDISSKCLSCIQPYILIGDNKCSLQCLSTQFKQNGTCIPCQSPCETCIDATNCLSCLRNTSQTKYLLNGSCVSQCLKFMYGDLLSLKCKNCVFPCSECLSSIQCLSCASGYLNVAKKTCEVCSSNYYPDETTKTCQLCSSALPNCIECQSSSICKSCFEDFYLLNSICVSAEECQKSAGYYINLQLNKCSQCVPPCITCKNSSYCLTCSNGYLFQGRCPLSCPAGYFANLTSKTCQPCNLTVCMTCVNQATQCTSCNPSSILSVYLVENKTCISINNCPQSHYLDDDYGYLRCLKCISPCKTCLNASYCLSCTSGVLYQGSCSFSCPNRFFADETVTLGVVLCQQCSSSCLECTSNDTNCISCPVTKLLQQNQCVDQCSPRHYLNQYILECFKCQSPCFQCDSASYCKSCQDSQKILYYGQCIDQCPEGTYVNNQQCFTCPLECQLCSFSTEKNTPICDKCGSNLFMNSTSYGNCETQCKQNQYGDFQTRKCYPCQVPCQQCYTATMCKTCIPGYLLYKGQCYKGSQCMVNTFMDPFKAECFDQCHQPHYGDVLKRVCSIQCSADRLKVPIQGSRLCSQRCPFGYYVDIDYQCSKCQSEDYHCNNLLTYEVFAKSIFNRLYIKLKFNKDVQTQKISQESITILIKQLKLWNNRLLTSSQLRLLQSFNSESQKYDFRITERSTRAVWLQISTFKTLKNVQIQVSFSSYYVFAGNIDKPQPQTNLQHINASVLVSTFDQYSPQQLENGKPFQTYSIFLSILLFIIIIISIIGNFLSLFYPLIDYFQILFMIEFIQIDYPPDLNYFLYGFRHSHYLFLPQIFSTTNKQQYSETPGKFGIIVPDADFLTNTGHDFLIIFVCIGLVAIVKLIDFLLTKHIKSNKITNDPGCKNTIEYNVENQIVISSKIQTSLKNDSNSQQSSSANNPNLPSQRQLPPSQPFDKIVQVTTNKKIQLQIMDGKHGKIVQYCKIFMSRLKWNYFNDVCYCLYFYIVLFSYSQYYVIAEAEIISNVLAILSFLATLFLPGFFIYLIYTNKQVIETYHNQNEIYLPFKTFYYFRTPDSGFSLYQTPIRYIRKLIVAILLVYCSQFPEFVLGIVMMFSLLNVIMMFLYKPFILRFQVYVQSTIEVLFIIVIFSICLLQLQYLNLDTNNKLQISKAVVAFTILLTVLLVIWNLIRFIVQLVKLLTGKDYFENYYKQPQKISEQQSKATKRSSSFIGDEKNNQIHEQSNVRLNQQNLSPNQLHQISSFGQHSQSECSGLDIYLRKQHDAPPMLIKCIKNFSDEESKSDNSQDDNKTQNKHQNQSQMSENVRMQNQKDERQSIGSDKKYGEKNNDKKSISNKSIKAISQKNYSENLQVQSIKSESIQLPNKQNIFQPSEQFQQQEQNYINTNQNNQIEVQSTNQPIFKPLDVQQIFFRNRTRDKNKLNTIIQVQDFDFTDRIQKNDQQISKMPISEENQSDKQDDDYSQSYQNQSNNDKRSNDVSKKKSQNI